MGLYPCPPCQREKKFIYKEIKKGGRASEFENAMNWLVSTGLVYRIEKYHPCCAIRVSVKGFNRLESQIYTPLYMAGSIEDFLSGWKR